MSMAFSTISVAFLATTGEFTQMMPIDCAYAQVSAEKCSPESIYIPTGMPVVLKTHPRNQMTVAKLSVSVASAQMYCKK